MGIRVYYYKLFPFTKELSTRSHSKQSAKLKAMNKHKFNKFIKVFRSESVEENTVYYIGKNRGK